MPSVPDKLQKFPWPHERLTFRSLFAGWWCLCRGWHRGHLIVHHQWELRWQCARSCLKVPTALMGTLLMRLPRLTCTTANVASVNYSGCVPQRPEISSATPSAGIFICFVLVLAGRWCQCQFWHRHDYVFLDLRQHSYPYRVHSCSKSAHLPLRRLRAAVCARCLQGGGVYVVGGTVAILWCTISGNTAYDSVRAHV